MNEPVVVLCGRPNVGKSSLFNAILGRRVAIVDPTAGVTRDRVSARVRHGSREFQLVDTGGIGQFDEALLKHEVERQIDAALRLADIIVFVVDAKDGLVPVDEEIARRLRATGKPMLLAANKVDGLSIERELAPFFRLGLGPPHPVSSVEKYGVPDLVERIVDALPPEERGEDARAGAEGDADDAQGSDAPRGPVRLAIVGKVNSGKSTLMNLLVGEERVIVSDLPGTTRDAIDAPFERGGRPFIAIDTAGLRKRRVVEGTPDFYGQSRAVEAIRRADVVLLLVDSERTISQIDKALAHEIVRAAKPVVIGVTKWDLARTEGQSPHDYEPYLRQQLPQLDFAPVAFLSAREGFNVDETLAVAADLYDQSCTRAGTGPLNRAIEKAFERRFPRTGRGSFPKILYATQVGIRPPTIVVFVNDRKLFDQEYERYLANRLREEFEFDEVPLRILFRDRHEGEGGGRRE